jgi:hypothetical protein
MNDNAKDVLQLLDGIATGKLIVNSYSSQWVMRGRKPTNQRKMTIVLEECKK